MSRVLPARGAGTSLRLSRVLSARGGRPVSACRGSAQAVARNPSACGSGVGGRAVRCTWFIFDLEFGGLTYMSWPGEKVRTRSVRLPRASRRSRGAGHQRVARPRSGCGSIGLGLGVVRASQRVARSRDVALLEASTRCAGSVDSPRRLGRGRTLAGGAPFVTSHQGRRPELAVHQCPAPTALWSGLLQPVLGVYQGE